MSLLDFRTPGHLPKRRPEGDHFDPARLPRQRRGVTPQMHGRYPDYDVLAEADHWDPVTRRVVLDRVRRVPPRRFFSEAEERALSAFCDVLLAQDAEPRIPVLRYVDEKLHAGRLEGYQYVDLPDDRELWQRVAAALDEAARERDAVSFAEATLETRTAICEAFSHGRAFGRTLAGVNVARAWKVITRDVVAAFYAHPWAWNEIGFGGPAYPRGFMRLGIGQREPYERDEAGPQDGASGTGMGG